MGRRSSAGYRGRRLDLGGTSPEKMDGCCRRRMDRFVAGQRRRWMAIADLFLEARSGEAERTDGRRRSWQTVTTRGRDAVAGFIRGGGDGRVGSGGRAAMAVRWRMEDGTDDLSGRLMADAGGGS
ncbi:hypothetical protein ACLOJK_007853, partial [Asimina triloba]